jgi:branched-chain amino acid transport system permease protein
MSDLARAASPAFTPAPTRLSGVLGTAAPWIAAAIGLVALPSVFSSGTALTMLSLMGITIVFALSYNMLLGQTGMLSFGHAVYYGLGAFFAVHAMNAVIRSGLPVPVVLIPLVGGLAGLVFGIIFGSVSTRRGGTAFAMISLGLAELVSSSANILRSFFGGEEGITTNRTKLQPVFDLTFGPQIQVYYLIAAWCLVCALAMWAITRTPLGRMCNAVRENAERAQFVGYNPQIVRFIAFSLAGFFAGIAGALAAINFEIVNASYVGLALSGTVLLAAFIGGIGYFAGPVIGAVLVTYLQVMLSDVTEIWQVYFGLLFIIIVMFAPGGIAGLLAMHGPLLRAGTLHRLIPAYLLALAPALLAFAGAVLLIELAFRFFAKSGEEARLNVFGMHLDASTLLPWIVALAAAAGGFLLFRRTWPVIANAWAEASSSGRGQERRRERLRHRAARRAQTVRAHRDHPRPHPVHPCRRAPCRDRPERGRQVDHVQPDQRASRALLGRDPPEGRDHHGLKPYEINRRGLSRSFQVTNIFPRLSVWENVRCAVLWSMGHRYTFWRFIDDLPGLSDRTAAVLEEINLIKRREVPAGMLAYAEQRALEIGVTIASGAEIILLDEPTAGMSHSEAEHAANLIRSVTENRTLVMVEHDMAVVFDLADRISVLVYGEIIATDTPARIRENRAVQEAYLGAVPAP